LVALAITVAPLALLSALNPAFSIAPFTGALVLLAPTLIKIGPIESAFYRVIEVSVGAISALIVSLVVLPARAHGMAIRAAAAMLELLAQALPELIAGLTHGRDRAVIQQIQDRIGEAFVRANTMAAEAKHEGMTNFASRFDQEPLLRTLLRMRHDVVMIGRAAVLPLPEPLKSRLESPLARVSETAAAYLRGASAALIARSDPPPLDAAAGALEAFAAEIELLRREGSLRDLPSDVLERIFTLGFAFEQLHRNFNDLARCVAELAPSPAPAVRSRVT
jgi:uncharacterized membrane protein YccC